MSDPSQDPDKSKSENLFKPSPKIMALRKKQHPLGLPNPGKIRYLFSLSVIAVSGNQIQSQKFGETSFFVFAKAK